MCPPCWRSPAKPLFVCKIRPQEIRIPNAKSGRVKLSLARQHRGPGRHPEVMVDDAVAPSVSPSAGCRGPGACRVEFLDKLQPAADFRKLSTRPVQRLRPTRTRLTNAPSGCRRSRRLGDFRLGTDVHWRVAEVTWSQGDAETSSFNLHFTLGPNPRRTCRARRGAGHAWIVAWQAPTDDFERRGLRAKPVESRDRPPSVCVQTLT